MFARRREAKLANQLDRLLAGEPIELPAGLLEEKLWQVLRSLEEAEQKSADERESVLQTISEISHQLKTPQAALSLYLEMASDDSFDESEHAAFLVECKRQVDKIGWLCDALLKITRLETGLIEVKKTSADLVQTVESALSAVRAEAEAKGLVLLSRLPEELVCPHDPVWTQEALVNILDNAVKYTPEGSITVSLEQGPIYARIDVLDTGIGLAAEEYSRVFGRFYRVRGSEASRIEGTGLGLTIAREIMRLQDGNITVSSELGKGSTFSIFLQSR